MEDFRREKDPHLRGITKVAIALACLSFDLTNKILSQLNHDDMMDVTFEMARLSQLSYRDEQIDECFGMFLYAVLGEKMRTISSSDEAIFQLEYELEEHPERTLGYILHLMRRF
jgi:flagellar motor switch protein FliG